LSADNGYFSTVVSGSGSPHVAVDIRLVSPHVAGGKHQDTQKCARYFTIHLEYL